MSIRDHACELGSRFDSGMILRMKSIDVFIMAQINIASKIGNLIHVLECIAEKS